MKYRIPHTTEADLIRFPDLEEYDGYLWRREGARLAMLARECPTKAIVEIGSNRGKSACFLARGAKLDTAGKRIHCVDLWTLGGQGEYNHLGFDQPETLDRFREQIASARVKGQIVEHQGDSVEVADEWTGGPVGLLFLDGDHRYEAVRADFLAWTPHLAPGAVVAFHDYTKGLRCTQFPGVVKLVDDLRALSRVTAARTGRLVELRGVV